MSVSVSRFVFALLSAAVLLSALMVINSTYQSRVLVNALRDLRAQGDLLAARRERLEPDYAWWAGRTLVARVSSELPGTQIARGSVRERGSL